MKDSTKCPKCGSRRMATILYGLPLFNEELDESLRRGEVTLGGCCITGSDPDKECHDCFHRW